jgi:hypothetical protein
VSRLKLPAEAVLYIRSMGKALRVTHIATTTDEANDMMKRDPHAVVVAEFAPFIFLADRYDSGVRISDASKEVAAHNG